MARHRRAGPRERYVPLPDVQVQPQLARDVQPVVDEHRDDPARLGAGFRDGLGDGDGVGGELVVVALLVPDLDHAHPAEHRLVRDPRHGVAPAAEVRIGDQVEPPVDAGAAVALSLAHGTVGPRVAHSAVTVTRPAMSSGVSVWSASSHATAKLPGPADVRPATVPAAPAWAWAATTASWSLAPAARAAPR